MATVRITGNWRSIHKLEFAGEPAVDAHGKIERSIAIPEEAYLAIEAQIAKNVGEGTLYLQDGRRFNWYCDRPAGAAVKPAAPPSQFFGIDTSQLPWEERFSDKIGKAIYRKELFSEPETGMLIRLVRYPAGVINPAHTHPCGHGMYVLEGTLVTHQGTFGPGSFVWFPEGEVMEHGASADADVVVVFVTNKPFRIDYV